MSWSEIGRGLSAMAGALAEVTMALNFMPKNVFGIGTGLVVVGAALNIISAALGKTGNMQWGEIAKGFSAMGGSMLILALGLNGMKKAIGGATALIVAASALALLVPEPKILGSMSIQQVGIALATLAGSFIVLGVGAKALKSVAGTLVKVSATIALFGTGLALAGAGMLAVSIGLTALSASLIIVSASLGEIISGVCYSIANSSKALATAFVGLIEAACLALKGTIPLVADTIMTVLVESLTSFKTYLPQIVDLVMDIIIQLMDQLAIRIPEAVTSATNMIGRFMDALDEAIGAKQLKSLIESLESVSIIFVAFAKTAEIISSLSVKGILKGLPAFAIAIAGFMVILAALGGLAQIHGFNWIIGEGGEVLCKIGLIIGEFIGNILNGIGVGLTAGLPEMGQNLSDFMTNITPFIDGARLISPDTVAGIKALAEAILIITAANIVSGIASFFSGGSSIADFGEEIAAFGPHLKAFSDSVTGISPDNVTAVAEAAKALAEMAHKVPNKGGLAGWFAGENNVAKFGDDIASFGVDIKAFSGNVENIVPDNVALAAEAGKNLAEMTSYIPKDGGVQAWLAGESSLAKFGKEIADFGVHITEFSKNVGDIKPANVTAAADAGKALAELTQTIPNESGIKNWFSGSQSLSKFGDQIADFGLYLQRFSDNVTDLNIDAVEADSEAGKAFAEMINCVPDQGSAYIFSLSVVDIGESLKTFTETMDGVNADTAVTEVNKIVTLAKNVKNADMSGLDTLTYSLESVSNRGITNFIDTFKHADERAKTAIHDFVNKVVTFVKGFNGDFGEAGSDYVTAFVNIIENKATSVSDGFKGVVDTALTAIKEKIADFQNADSEFMSKLLNGAKTKGKSSEDPFAAFVTNAVNSTTTRYGEFYNAGKYLSEGFSKGISENIPNVRQASNDMGQAALDAVTNTLDINSPSKKSYSLGDYTDMGYVTALDDYVDKSYEAGAGIAKSAQDGLADAISGISDIIDGNVDCTPTIRPVLDLSNVESGVSRMGGMIAANRSIDLAARTSFGVDTSIERHRNNSNEDVVDAVGALREDVASLRDVVGNLKVVMDGGALVGQIIDKMDAALGKKARLASRR